MRTCFHIIITGLLLMAGSTAAHACPQCRAAVREGILTPDLASRLAALLLPLLILLLVGAGLYYIDPGPGHHGER